MPDPSIAEARDTCLCYRLRRAARAVTRAYGRSLEPSGLTMAQFAILNAVAAGEGAGMTRLGAALGLDRTAATREAAPLVARGLLRHEAAPDGRRIGLAITEAGQSARRAALPHWRAAQSRARAALGEDWTTLHAALRAAERAVEEPA